MSLNNLDAKALLKKQQQEIANIQHKIIKTQENAILWKRRLVHPFAFFIYGVIIFVMFSYTQNWSWKEVYKAVLSGIVALIGEKGVKSLLASNDEGKNKM